MLCGRLGDLGVRERRLAAEKNQILQEIDKLQKVFQKRSAKGFKPTPATQVATQEAPAAPAEESKSEAVGQ